MVEVRDMVVTKGLWNFSVNALPKQKIILALLKNAIKSEIILHLSRTPVALLQDLYMKF